MKRSARISVSSVICVAALAAAVSARALEQGVTEQNLTFVSGGASIEEASLLESQRLNYRLWLTTSDQVSGAWLADAKVVIQDAQGNVVLDTQLDGPYLFVDLAPGRYAMTTTLESKVRRNSLIVTDSRLQQISARFNTGARVASDMPHHVLAAVTSIHDIPISLAQ